MGLHLLAETRDVVSERKKEIERHLNFIKDALDKKTTNLAELNGVRSSLESGTAMFDRGLIKTLSASTYLLLYNLIECAMTNAIDSIHVHIKREKTGFHELSENMKRIALRNFSKALDSENNILSQSSIEHAIVWLGYDGERLFSGNIDARKVKIIAKNYGFDIPKKTLQESENGKSLLTIKSKRNELAHGKISFEECGQECSIEELFDIYSKATAFVDGILDAIENYVAGKLYLHQS